MEKCGFVSDRCKMNRQIREDNRILRQIKDLVKSLTEAVKQSVPVIAEKLEMLRERLIFSQYELKHNEKLSDNIRSGNLKIDTLLKRFDDVKCEISQKISKGKNYAQRRMRSVS